MSQNPDAISIRRGEAADNILLAELGALAFAAAFAAENTPEDMAAYLAEHFGPAQQAAELADPAAAFLIAEQGGEAIGYARLKRGPAPACIRGERPIEIARFYAHPNHIGHGIGAALMPCPMWSGWMCGSATRAPSPFTRNGALPWWVSRISCWGMIYSMIC